MCMPRSQLASRVRVNKLNIILYNVHHLGFKKKLIFEIGLQVEKYKVGGGEEFDCVHNFKNTC